MRPDQVEISDISFILESYERHMFPDSHTWDRRNPEEICNTIHAAHAGDKGAENHLKEGYRFTSRWSDHRLRFKLSKHLLEVSSHGNDYSFRPDAAEGKAAEQAFVSEANTYLMQERD
jgi:hypothetical protein